VTTTAMRPRATLDRIAIPPGSRYLIVGQTGSGKSTLAGVLLTDWVRKGRRLVIFDTKPRWKAEYLANGMSASRRYRGWTLGEPFPNSISVTTWDEWVAARSRLGERTIIVQTLIGEPTDLDLHAAVAVDVWRTAGRVRTPTLYYLDETMDHFRPGTTPWAQEGWIWSQVCRAGRELGVAACFSTQRPTSIPLSILQETTQLALFSISDNRDMRRLWEIGFPRGRESPERLHEFVLWRSIDKRRVWGPFRLDLGKSQEVK